MISQEELKRRLSYEPSTGIFRWKVRPSNCVRVGDIAGTTHLLGYQIIAIEGKRFYGHRLAWLYVYGKWPPHEVDHINEDKSDNRFVNLRLATHGQNGMNRGRSKNNTSGYKGVVWSKKYGLWVARITKDRRSYFLGNFESPEKAHEAYCSAVKQHHGEFART